MNPETYKSTLIHPGKKRKQTYAGQSILKSIPCLPAKGMEGAAKGKGSEAAVLS